MSLGRGQANEIATARGDGARRPGPRDRRPARIKKLSMKGG